MFRSTSICFLLAVSLPAGEVPRAFYCFPGKTPVLDGVLSPGEWDDATHFFGVTDWTPRFSPAKDAKDLSLNGYVKHDNRRLYFAFDVTDDVLYGIDTPRWLPDGVHPLAPERWPWFGDAIQLLINASNKWNGDEGAAGDGSSWQMVCNLTKSRLGGPGKGGLLEGDPVGDAGVPEAYQRWIATHAMEAVAAPKPNHKGYIVEWAINFDPCLEVEPGRFYSPLMGIRAMGLNIAVDDLDQKEKGAGVFGNLHHEQWFAGPKNGFTELRNWGTLWIMSSQGSHPPAAPTPTPAVVKPRPLPTKRSRK
jgi:solute:Na+ symporter, SSS family